MSASNALIEIDGASELLRLLEEYKEQIAAPSPHADRIVREIDAYKNVKSYLTLLSQQLAQHAKQRQLFFDSGLFSTALKSVCSFYTVFEKVQAARPPPKQEEQDEPNGNAPSIDAKEAQNDPYYRVSLIATLCMRILRNGMAGCAEAQSLLCQQFDFVAPFLANITRFHTLNDPDTPLLSRSAVQMLSNLITANEDVQRRMWTRIVITDRDEDKLVLKFLSSPDTATQSAAQILLINFIRAPKAAEAAQRRCYQLCSSLAGLQLIQSLLSSSDSIMLRTASATNDSTMQEYEPESEIDGLEESLGFIYTIFAILFEGGYSSLLVSSLAPIEEISSRPSTSMQSELPIISSSQLTLLKLLDSWLHLSQRQVAESSSASNDIGGIGPKMRLGPAKDADSSEGGCNGDAGLLGLLDFFMQLSAFARSAMLSGIAKNGASADQQPQDRRLIGVHHGLLLLLQSLLSICLTADGWSNASSNDELLCQRREASFVTLSRALLSAMRCNEALVDELVALLDQTHQYAPALSPFRPTKAKGASGESSNVSNGDAENRPLPQGHALSSTGKAAQEAKGAQPTYGFDHLKRDIVRLLGSLVYAPTAISPGGASDQASRETSALPVQTDDTHHTRHLAHTKAQIRQVQDRVRDKGGLFHILNMTVLDERNPYMREHAIFALRYLLAGNAESQSLVSSLQPAEPNDGQSGMQLPMV
ncbi:uncharacterized protein UTRI_04662_B [Ustilago trichophora]|uniref:Ataxin-10 homolog n=1 Tax=Ustilago trichophora TaxID=86804 RepID=A0A5C3EF01_9BASI|nr:uncharacterized protein UTRI_04662_B [Ustilago trichophora]